MNHSQMKWSLQFTDGLQTSPVRVIGYMNALVTWLQGLLQTLAVVSHLMVFCIVFRLVLFP